MKDYYQILGIEPSSTRAEIKKAWRQLAQQYHPDKNGGDPYAAARFTEIKEAYEVLTDPAKKEYYLEQRWYEQSRGRKKAQTVVTPESVLKQVIEFDRHVSRLDVHRMNRQGLIHCIKTELLAPDTIEKLNGFDETETNKEIVSFILKNLFVIPPDQLSSLQNLLLAIKTGTDFQRQIDNVFLKIQKEQQREKYRIWVLLFIVLMIVMIIYFIGS